MRERNAFLSFLEIFLLNSRESQCPSVNLNIKSSERWQVTVEAKLKRCTSLCVMLFPCIKAEEKKKKGYMYSMLCECFNRTGSLNKNTQQQHTQMGFL
jgi:hypothetical protein